LTSICPSAGNLLHRNPAEALPSGTEHILLVDDELLLVRMGSQILERLGYTVTMRTNSQESLELFRAKPDEFDLVITDMAMPNMTGDVLAKELLQIRNDIPIILCTGYSKTLPDEGALAFGIKAFTYKPMVKKDLALIVRKVLDNPTIALQAPDASYSLTNKGVAANSGQQKPLP
jgi:CheY-like chemotaxis protein